MSLGRALRLPASVTPQRRRGLSPARSMQPSEAWAASGLAELAELSDGDPALTVAVIDGPVALGHPHFADAQVEAAGPLPASCRLPSSAECAHGTFVMGTLAARRGDDHSGLVPRCRFVVRTLFPEARDARDAPLVSAEDLAAALHDVLDAGARVINLSVGLGDTRIAPRPALEQAFERARSADALVVAASGNYGVIGAIPLFSNPWVIPVVGVGRGGQPLAEGNLGPSLGQRGLSAPGEAIVGSAPGGGTGTLTGTSAAAPFVSGAAALLLSHYPQASAASVRRALLQPGARRSSVVPPPLNGDAALASLRQEIGS